MKKKTIFVALAVSLIALVFGTSCASGPAPKMSVILEDKGKGEGLATPSWVQAAIMGEAQNLEKTSAYANMIVVITSFDGQELQRAQQLADKMQLQSEMRYLVSLRVEKLLKDAKVPGADFKSFGAYSELFLKAVAEATYSDFRKEADWWVKLQTYKADGTTDKQLYRVLQLWVVEKKTLKKQLDLILTTVHGQVAPIPENIRAKNLIQNSLDAELFGAGN